MLVPGICILQIVLQIKTEKAEASIAFGNDGLLADDFCFLNGVKIRELLCLKMLVSNQAMKVPCAVLYVKGQRTPRFPNRRRKPGYAVSILSIVLNHILMYILFSVFIFLDVIA